MTEAGLPFRGTKDLDIVLHVEVIELPAKLQADLLAFAKAVVELNRPEQVQAVGRIASAYAFDL